MPPVITQRISDDVTNPLATKYVTASLTTFGDKIESNRKSLVNEGLL